MDYLHLTKNQKKKLLKESQWLIDNPAFEQCPATMEEFLGKNYLNIDKNVRRAIKTILRDIFGKEIDSGRVSQYLLAVITGGIGIGKTFLMSIILTYLVHWLGCLYDPPGFFDLAPGTRMGVMLMSTKATQAQDVIFSEIRARIEHSVWFREQFMPNEGKATKRLRKRLVFPKDIYIIPGDSEETTFEGYNIFGGVIDEGDSFQVTERKDYAEEGYDTIFGRMDSRFGDKGFLAIIGQKKSNTGFIARMFKEFTNRDDSYAKHLAIWEAKNKEDYCGDSFLYDSKRHEFVEKKVGAHVIRVPVEHRKFFDINPDKALRDLAGIPPAAGSPFLTKAYKVEDCFKRYKEHYGVENPKKADGSFYPYFKSTDSLPRFAHIDLGLNKNSGDATGVAMGHISHWVEIDGEERPYIIIDYLDRVAAPPGQEVDIGGVRQDVYELKEYFNYRLRKVTYDGWQSTGSIQEFKKRHIWSEAVSIDKNELPYSDLKDAIYEDRIEFPRVIVTVKKSKGVPEYISIVEKELSELEWAFSGHRTKIDHPLSGSKDVADALAGVVYALMNTRRARRRAIPLDRNYLTQKRVTATIGSNNGQRYF